MYLRFLISEGFVSKISYYKDEDKKLTFVEFWFRDKIFSDIQVEQKLKIFFCLNKNIIKKWKFSFTWQEV